MMLVARVSLYHLNGFLFCRTIIVDGKIAHSASVTEPKGTYKRETVKKLVRSATYCNPILTNRLPIWRLLSHILTHNSLYFLS